MKLIFSLSEFKKHNKVIPQWAIDLDGAYIQFDEDSNETIEPYGKLRLLIKKEWCIKE